MIFPLEPRRLFTATFTLPTPTAGINDAQGLAVGDFNKDGKLDLVTTGRQSVNGEVTARYGFGVYLGNGDGTFQPVNFIVTNGRPYQVVTFDANGDGNLDLITSDATSSNLVVVLGNGNGTFQSTPLLSGYFGSGATGYALSFIDSADFNKDGKQDVVVSFTPNDGVDSYLAFMYQTTGGAFNADHLIAIGGPGPVVAGDFNADGSADIAYAVGAAKQVFLRTDTSANGSFQQFDIGEPARFLFKGDFNGDGKIDLGVPTTSGTTATQKISLFLNGNFANRIDIATPPPFTVAAADFDGDTQTDLVSFQINDEKAQILTSTGGPAYSSPVDFDLNNSAGFYSATGDFNNDGKTDVAYTVFNTGLALQGGVGVLLNNSVTVPPVSPPPPPPPGGIPDGTVFVLGAKNKKPLKQTITYTNNSGSTQSGNATARLVLSTNQTYEPGADTEVFSSTKKANLKAGKSLKVNANLQTISSVAAQNYYLLSVVTDPSGATTVTNASTTVSVQNATVNLSGSFSKQPVAITSTKKNTITLTVTNNGNTTFKGALPVGLFASADTAIGGDVDLGSATKNVNLTPGKSVKVTYSFTPSTASSVTPAYLGVRLDPGNSTNDPDTSNNTFFSSSTIAFT